MNNERQEKILKIIKKQIQTTERHLLKLKLSEYENKFCNVISVTNILTKEEQQFFITKLKKLIELYQEFQVMRSNQSIKVSY